MAALPQAIISINATGGAGVQITAKTFARGVTIQEDGSGAAAGLAVTWPSGNTDNYTPSQQPITIGNVTGGGPGPLFGAPANSSNDTNSATLYCTIVSMGAATKVLVTEYN